jgi:predicted HD superfamily hydrolase involved in NAD metabolism
VTALLREQIKAVRREFESRPAGLARHVERVLAEALALAERWDIDRDRVELATWGHDLFRATPGVELLKMAGGLGIEIDGADLAEPVLLHGPVGASVLERSFGVDDEEVLAAVRDHTLGQAEMPLIARLILLADKVEARKRKRTPVMKEIRRLARRDLDAALLCWADWKWVEERRHGWRSHPRHWEARACWVRQHHAEVRLPPRTESFDLDEAPAEGMLT